MKVLPFIVCSLTTGIVIIGLQWAFPSTKKAKIEVTQWPTMHDSVEVRINGEMAGFFPLGGDPPCRCEDVHQRWLDWYDARREESSRITQEMPGRLNHLPTLDGLSRNVTIIFDVMDRLQDNWYKPHP